MDQKIKEDLIRRIESGMTTIEDAEHIRDLHTLAEQVSRLDPDAGEIGAGKLCHLVEMARKIENQLQKGS